MESLNDKHILVLGGSDGIGLATAQYLLNSGSVVTISGRSQERLDAAVSSLTHQTDKPGNLRAQAADANKAEDVIAAVKAAENDSGFIDGIVVVAGAGDFGPILENQPEFVTKQFTNNLYPLVNSISLGVPRMPKDGGSIVAISSSAGIQPSPGLSAFGAAKAALDHYVRAAADELGPKKVRVNAIRPALTKTGSTHYVFNDQRLIERFVEQTPLGRYGVPEDFAGAISFMLADESRWITGQCIAVDGGMTLRRFPDFS